ncbi:MAG: hypothetical protein IT162_07640 [Bryobacterales bacterium]|nr:hypothetical protein [Bryobacterales bacterium]
MTTTGKLHAHADDEPVTEEDHRRILEGNAALARGEQGISMEDMLAEFGLKLEDFLLQC